MGDENESDELPSPPPRTSPLGAIVGVVVAVSASVGGCYAAGETARDSGPLPDANLDANWPDAGTDVGFPGELPAPPPDANPSDAGASNS